MSRHTSWRVGGCAEQYYQPASIEDAGLFLKAIDKDTPVTWVGLGSNLLVRDGGISGVVINATGMLNNIDFISDTQVYAEVGVACPKLARQSVKQGMTGLEFLCGIPGTIGGALAMNAGAMGSETWDFVESVITLERNGEMHTRDKSEYEIAYRSVKSNHDEFFVAANFRLEIGDQAASEKRMKAYLARRASTQPTQLPNAGSVFRNPEGDYAARLIEECGLKGYCIGGASVSEKHANFIINTGTATASDIENLILFVKQTVKDQHNIELHAEVKIIGDSD